VKLNEVLEFREGQDTRTLEPLNIYKIKKDLKKEEYIKLNTIMKEKSCYYSKFVGAFICKTKLDLEIPEGTPLVKKEKKNVKYGKLITDYITLEEYKEVVKEFAKENYRKSWNYKHSNYATEEEAMKEYQKELLDNIEHCIKYDWFGNLKYIREAILEKSLGYKKEDFRSNGDALYYRAIWDKLPIIEGIHLTEEAYTAMWGYDQTNVDIAFRVNERVWGLDIFRDTDGRYYLVRMKNGCFHDSVRYFTRDLNPWKTFKQDASQTGNYR
jgi:hypothetical protein